MNVIIDGIEYQPVEQKVDQEREDAVEDMIDIYYTGDCKGTRFGKLYDAGYRKAGEAVSFKELNKFVDRRVLASSIAIELLGHFTITKKEMK